MSCDACHQTMAQLHAHVWGPQDDGDTFACVKQALQLGVNFFDTAEMCGVNLIATVTQLH